ncbi:hypothetical protein Hanom_Chr16g01456271 [Helianthus anomalus]
MSWTIVCFVSWSSISCLFIVVLPGVGGGWFSIFNSGSATIQSGVLNWSLRCVFPS